MNDGLRLTLFEHLATRATLKELTPERCPVVAMTVALLAIVVAGASLSSRWRDERNALLRDVPEMFSIFPPNFLDPYEDSKLPAG